LRRIVYLFKKCLIKFKKDESIWMEFFNFLIKHKCHNIINREIGSCLVNNPYNLDFWRIAAYNELENNSNFLSARNIFQKCLRLNKKNYEAHLDYFIFELKFVQKIVERRTMLSVSIFNSGQGT
jgi:U3 small nucleolar RNA-associated protein 6